MTATATRLRELLARPGLTLAPGAYDGLSAKLIEQAGFKAVHATGAGIAASMGYPDLGLITMTEMLDRIRQITAATSLPVIADADTGYGNVVNVTRTVREFERAGCAGLHIEDQVMPKKCGQLAGRQLIPREEMAANIRAALAARSGPDFVIIARTDAREGEGLEGAIRRAQAYRAAGADMIFVMAPHGEAELKAIAEAVPGPLMCNQSMGGKTPPVPKETLERLGYRVCIYAVASVMAAAFGMREVLTAIRQDGTDEACHARMMGFKDLYRSVGLAEAEALEARFRPEP